MTSLRFLLPRSTREPTRGAGAGRRRLLLALGVSVLLAAAVGGWLLWRGDEPAAAARSTATVATETVKETVAASGTVAAASSEDLAFEVSGTVTDVYVDEGDRVRVGDVIAAVDASSLRAARAAAASALEAAEVQLDEDRDADADEVQIAADEAAVLAARASLEVAEDEVAGAVLRSPIRGLVTSVGIEVGDVVGSGSSAVSAADSSAADTGSASGTVTVTSRDRFLVEATVSSEDLERLSEGQQAEITVTGVEETVYGTVESVGLIAQTSSTGAAVFPVTLEVTGRRKDLYAGTSADAAIVVKQTEGVLTVNSRALSSEGDATFVDRVVEGETVRTEVEIGDTYGVSTEVLSGLEEGDVVELPLVELPGGGGGEDMRQRFEEGGFPGGGQLPPGGFPGGGAPGGVAP